MRRELKSSSVHWWSAEHPMNIGYMVGPNYQLQREARLMQKRGEVKLLGGPHRLPGLKPGEVAIMYTRLMSRKAAKMRLLRRRLILWGSVFGVYGLSMAWLVWESRYLLMQVGGFALLLAAVWIVFRIVTGHRATCPGLHCKGCRG